MSSAVTPSIFGSAPAPRRGSDNSDSSPSAGAVTRTSHGPGGIGKQREALKLRLDLNLEVEISIKAKVNGDITLSLFPQKSKGPLSGYQDCPQKKSFLILGMIVNHHY
ncbi:uncharacterized protein ARMOST_19654 [Armillaria ostoyae]|uniref:Uncharacterized protein n=1 Tax=Armillaria ostoyae TaxID=47428 RepID=A0A284S543_ARMOS|nr:uncharacterized protein ARMOST_19654 [Armillaria ostoyae]